MATDCDSCRGLGDNSEGHQSSLASQGTSDWSLTDFEVLSTASISVSSRVFVARERGSDAPCILKRISKSSAARHHLCKQIVRELSIHSRLRHPNVVEMFAWFHDSRGIYLVMERADMTVSDLIQSRRPGHVDVSTCMRMILHLLTGLAYLHALHIIHRDIKPSNLLLVSAGTRYTLKIGDFGCSVHTTDIRRSARGTTPYLAPEVVDGTGHSFAVDIWSCGITAHEMATGDLFFDGDSPIEIFHNILHQDYHYCDNIDSRIGAIVSACLQKDPLKRPTAIELMKKIACD